MRTVIVYTKPGCMQCRAIIRALDASGVPYDTVDMSVDPDARDVVLALGYLRAPVVYAGPHNHFSGYRPDRVLELARAAG